jgi:hypothetical protein
VRLPSRAASLAHRIVEEHASLPRMEATAMNVSDMRTKVEGAEKSSLVTRIADLDETPVLTLVDTSEQSDASEMPDPLIQALVNKLPKPNSVWSNEDRAKWLRAAAIIFNLVYKPEANEIDAKIENLPSDLKSAG